MGVLTTLFLMPAVVLALNYDTTHLPYSDAPADLPTSIAISTLTKLGIIEGFADGTVRADAPLNRAEFLKIVMGLLPPDKRKYASRCFPDVEANIWYSEPVCRAKEFKIISGNAVAGVPESQWLFEPTRPVRYEEALKILARIYGVPLVEAPSGEWYETYLKTAQKLKVGLYDSTPGSWLTRGQMARVTVAFTAYAKGELDALRAAENPQSSSSPSSRTSSSRFASSVSPVSSNSSIATSSSLATYDPFINDTGVGDSVLVLGKVTPVLGASKLFSNSEGILVDAFLIDLEAANSSIAVFNVYDHDGKFLGRATLDTSVSGNIRYRLNVSSGVARVPRREDYTFYVRAILKAQDAGGNSGEEIEIDRMGIIGIGEWSTRSYEQYTSSETFARSTTARSAITSVSNAGEFSTVLVPGPTQEIGAFRFAGVTGHPSADLTVTKIVFQVEQTGVTLSNAYMRVDGGNTTHACTISGSQITCQNLPESFGALEDGPRTLRVYADIAVGSGLISLRLSINDPGTIDTAGSITWTDGTTVFTWIGTDERPVARGTYYSY